jgi:hypothetical protein
LKFNCAPVHLIFRFQYRPGYGTALRAHFEPRLSDSNFFNRYHKSTLSMADSTSIHEHRGWVTEPSSRGTLGLIWSCFSVIFICCWSAIYPNVPGPKDSDRCVLLRKIRYAAMCLVTPELFVAFAAEQWLERKNVSKNVAELMNAEEEKESNKIEVG